MPFVQRQIEPKFIARRSSAANKKFSSTGASSSPLRDNELEAITNLTLSNAIRQLASLLALSKEIFTELNEELEKVNSRSTRLKERLTSLNGKIEDPSYDAKLVVVPESDFVTFLQIKNHFKTDYGIGTNLFTVQTRSEAIRRMYDAAAKTPVHAMEELDELMGIRGRRSSDAFICTPILERTRRRLKGNIDIEIETRMPASIDELRKWTSKEAIGDETVAPNCVARVSHNTSIAAADTSVISLRPAIGVSPEDCTDSIIMITSQNASSRSNDEDKDSPLDHRLPSPEEQCQILASKYPAQLVRVDTSGKRFDRQSAARKSLLHVQTGMAAVVGAIEDQSNDSSNTDSVKRRSRSRKPRGNRRNTIGGIDQKEMEGIENAVNGLSINDEIESGMEMGEKEGKREVEMSTFRDNEIAIAPRSKSSDVLKRDLLSTEAKRSSYNFNSLKQWGKSRLRMINRLSSGGASELNQLKTKQNSNDIDDFNVLEAINKRQKKINEKDRRLSHERKPSYSSSERSLNISSTSTQAPANNPPAVTAISSVVRMREQTAVLRRQRRHGVNSKEEPHSSSGNWSASSESGRTSIGSEITSTTAHPKSSASSTSLSHHHSSSGPPSSIISRRRFLNTSASSSITSEGTATPELLPFDGFHDEGETSSVYSCDTEGYYTSFHVDSGLKTLKEEESLTPMQSSMALSSTNSFESSGNQTVISPENEYELFGKGSTTTSSSAGTVCTAVLSHYEERLGPSVPERKSSLCKLNRSSSTSSGTLERSYSTSTVGSTLEKSGTIKRNGVLLQKEVAALVHQETLVNRIESPDSGNNTSSSPVDSNSSPTNQNVRLYSEFECSESSDLECIERTERIREKTTINTSRIPSICAITPTPSDDEKQQVIEEIKIKDNLLNVNHNTGYATVMPNNQQEVPPKISRKNSPLLPLNNMLDKLRGVLHPLKKSPNKENNPPMSLSSGDVVGDEYVTISDVSQTPKRKPNANGIYYSSNDVLKRNLATVLSGNINEETEYVSLNELPCNVRSESNLLAISENNSSDEVEKIDKNVGRDEKMRNNEGCSGEEKKVVKMDAHGNPIYDSNSLKRKKGAITTFSPGPCVKEDCSGGVESTNIIKNHIEENPVRNSPQTTRESIYRRTNQVIRPVVAQRLQKTLVIEDNNNNNNQMTSNNHLMRPNGSLSLNLNSVSSKVLASGTIRGAYVNIQDSAPLLNGPPVYSPPSPSRAALIFGQQAQEDQDDGDYVQPFYHHDNNPMTSSYTNYEMPPFQRNSNVYWTLQTRHKTPAERILSNDAYQNSANPHGNIESLYSTPHKNRQNLKTTPMGFEFFSPVPNAKLNERIVEVEEVEAMSPIDPRNSGQFITSTPTQRNVANVNSSPVKSLSEDIRNRLRMSGNSGIRSVGNSPINSGRSTPSKLTFEPQSRSRHSWSTNNVEVPPASTTCSDRLGTPKTSLMDFKKLLLNKTSSSPRSKISAVELLKMSKSNVQKSTSPVTVGGGSASSSSPLNILDLSGSPKTFATRRMIRQGQFGNLNANSPTKPQKQKQAWRLQTTRTDVISTAIPEAANDEEQQQQQPTPEPRKIETIKSPEIIINECEEPTNLKENLFIKQDENNFTETEIRDAKKSAHIQQRAQFLFGNNSTANNVAVFKNGGHYAGIKQQNSAEKESIKPSSLPASLETAL